MGMMMSNIKEIDDLDFKPFPARPVALKKCIRVDGQLIGIGNKGTLYATGRLADNAAFLPADWYWLQSVLKALVKLEVITQAVADAYRKRCLQADEVRSARSTLEHVVPELEKEYGVKLTKAQRAKIERRARL